MTKIGLLSDTHSDLPEKVFEYFADVDEIWHAGDIGDLKVTDKLKAFKPLRAVYGNIDNHQIRQEFPLVNQFKVEDVEVIITHIAGRPPKFNPHSIQLLETIRPQIFVCGHSHVLLVQHDKRFNTLWLNPGACGNKGFHQMKTLLRFTIDGAKISNMEVIELGKRSMEVI